MDFCSLRKFAILALVLYTNHMPEMLKILLKSITRTKSLEMILPFVTVVIFFSILILFRAKKKNAKLTIIDGIIAALQTIAAYFAFICILDLKRIDYVFDFFRYYKEEFTQIGIVFKSMVMFDSGLPSIIRTFAFQFDPMYLSLQIINRCYLVGLLDTILTFSKKIKFDLLRFINEFHTTLYHTNIINCQELCVFRC